MCGPSRNRKQEAAIAEQNRILEEQRRQQEARLAEQRRLEQERANKISGNVSSIGSAFSKFDDPFFEQAGSNVREFFTPQLQEQFEEAQEKTAFNLANKGLSDSSVAADKAGELKDLFDRELRNIETKAGEAENQLRTDVSNRRSNLIRLAESGTGLDNFSELITPEVSSVQLPTNFNALGDVFGSVVNDIDLLQRSGVLPTFVNSGGQKGATSGNSARVIK